MQPPRHSSEDGVVYLNVGGTRFLTLRSTLSLSPVLKKTVEMAATNHGLMLDGAIFVDRDPKHFQLILNHLRNLADGDEPRKALFDHGTAVQLPSDAASLRDLYMEAAYYDLDEFCERILNKQKWSTMMKVASTGNPFDAAARAAMAGRTLLVLVVGAISGKQAHNQIYGSKAAQQQADAHDGAEHLPAGNADVVKQAGRMVGDVLELAKKIDI